MNDLNVLTICKNAKTVAPSLALLSSAKKNEILHSVAKALDKNRENILKMNSTDLKSAKEKSVSVAMLDRLTLTNDRIDGMIGGILKIISLADPVGEVVGGGRTLAGFNLINTRVPLGVVGIIYEARPNVTSDAAVLCLKSGNAVILRGGSEAVNSNIAIVSALREGIAKCGVSENAVQLLKDTSREKAAEMMRMHGYIDVLIPRGGSGLIKNVLQNSTVPVIETGMGNCHTFVDQTADLSMALRIVDNAKTSRPSVCNALETLLLHESIADEFLGELISLWGNKNVALFGCEKTHALTNGAVTIASEQDWETEFNDLVLAIKIVTSIDEAIQHINKYGTQHSEAIVTRDYDHSQKFCSEVDAAAVYVNASIRFTDGEMFGLGAEMGISTQKLHIRGPMGLTALTTNKYIINGNGEIRV